MKRLVGVAVAVLLGACGGESTAEMEEDYVVGGDEQAVTCSPRMSVFPVKGKHNIGYDAASCGTGTCAITCPDQHANSDWAGSAGHHGIDIFAWHRAPLVAVTSGTIVKVGVVSATSGLRVRLRDACGWEYYYGHLDQAVVTQNQKVQAGQLIGYMGRSGTPSVHLHFNVSPDGNYSSDINPFSLLKATSPTACQASPPPSTIPAGPFKTSDGGVYYSNGQAYCRFTTMCHVKQCTGLSSVSGLQAHALPASMANHGDCGTCSTSPNVYPPGVFHTTCDGTVYYSNGSRYCAFSSMDQLRRCMGSTATGTARSAPPGGMIYDGVCGC